MAWIPPLEGNDAKEANDAIDAIAEELESRLHESSDPSVGRGNGGGAIFYEWLARARGEEKYRATAERLLNQASEWVGERVIGPQFYSGFTGVAWALELLGDPTSDDDANEDIDPVLVDYVRHSSDDNYDLISGYAGLAVYFLRRLPRITGQQGLEAILQRLQQLAEKNTPGVAWVSPKTFREQAAYEILDYNLGVAHGIPGLIAILGEIVGRTAIKEASVLLNGAVEFLLSCKSSRGASVFPHQVKRGDLSAPAASRPTWCYGDLGISLTLLSAARWARNSSWESEAIQIAQRSALIPIEASRITDTGLCHGFAGTAHLFNRLFNATGDLTFRETSRNYYRHLLGRRGKTGIGGFQSLSARGEGWESNPGFLTGACGIGLALLAATSPVGPDWDEMLLVSVPPR